MLAYALMLATEGTSSYKDPSTLSVFVVLLWFSRPLGLSACAVGHRGSCLLPPFPSQKTKLVRQKFQVLFAIFSVVCVCSYVYDGGDVSEDPSIILHSSAIATICNMYDRESPQIPREGPIRFSPVAAPLTANVYMPWLA